MGAGLFWAFVLELFEDRRTLTLGQFAPALLLLLLGLVGVLASPPMARTLWLLHNVASAALIVHALFVVWNGWRGDLIEQRRRLRGPILAISAVYAFTVVVVQTWELYFGFARSLWPVAAGRLCVLASSRSQHSVDWSPICSGNRSTVRPGRTAKHRACKARMRAWRRCWIN
jgi:hypothetical protein